MDPRNVTLAKNLVNYSCKIKKGEKVLVLLKGMDGLELATQIIKEVYNVGGIPFSDFRSSKLIRELLLNASVEQLDLMAKVDSLMMENMDAFISIDSNPNASELSDVPSEKITMYQKHYNKVVHSDLRVAKTKWVVMRYPTNSMAQSAQSSLENFEEFYYKVCNLDYAKMGKAMESLVDLMNKTDKVQIKGVGTDLTFSIKNIPTIPCAGELNIPDGEVFTAPVKNSINGTLAYNTPSEYLGYTYENIVLTFKDGKIVDAIANDTAKINEVFDTDDGARYIGEFAIGVNPYILKPMKDTLFDEKIMGSFHFTPGNCYNEAPNGNKSAIHWDLVCIQTEAFGGGEIYFDDVLIRKNGMFVIKELECLNPENLK